MSTLRVPPADALGPPAPDTPDPTVAGSEAVRAILALVAGRAGAEAEADRTRVEHDESADHDYREKRGTLDARYASLTEGARKDDEERRRKITDDAIQGEAAAKSEFAKASRKIAADFDAAREQAKGNHARARHKAATEAEAAEKAAVAESLAGRRPIDDVRKFIDRMRTRLAALHADYRHFGLPDAPTEPSRGAYKPDDPVDRVYDRLGKLEADLVYLEKLAIPKLMRGERNLWIYFALFVVVGLPLIWFLWLPAGPVAALVVAGVGGYLVRAQLYALSSRQVGRWYLPLSQGVVDAEGLATDRRREVDARLGAERARVAEVREAAQLRAKMDQAKEVTVAENARDDRLRRINETYATRKVEIQTTLAREMADAIDAHRKRQAELPARYEAGTAQLSERYRALKQRIRDDHDRAGAALADRWRSGMAAAREAVDGANRVVAATNPAWDDPGWADRPAPTGLPPTIRHGEVRLDLGAIPGGIPGEPGLMQGIDPRFALPAVVPFPERANLAVEAPAAGRAQALGVVQAAMFRLLTGLPPGLVRFTLIDPVGIGRSFGAFMHLADFDEALVSGQVWTEPRQVEERLADLAAHMEKVTQKYLRDEYASIDEYNAVAGEVAEPYRVLVVADFPAAFDEKSAARLAGIIAAGVPCGVITLVARDLDRPLPSGFAAEDLRPGALALTWDPGPGGFAWPDPVLGAYPLVLDGPPAGETAARLVRRAGAGARDAKRVEVPFEFIAPAPDAWWTQDSRGGIDIPLGKAGATKRQHLALGKGTSQHVLVAGRTGSGKSTLLHALIVNVALNYSPDEVELYLIDFKKGVEFKVYATEALPHAAVVAIESEREFGISVLQRLDAEIRARADRFRDVGVADLAGYRNAPGTPPMPRILLVVDEFQEFFVEEDKLAQEAALVLDRLVRQGRAFGVHVHLGSQSLGGAYALARTTLGQMAVRIALQCSESDAHLILSEQNPAAKLLSRPGEAIYNDANGSPEGNHFFQVVWLGDDRRAAYLRQLRELAEARPPSTAAADRLRGRRHGRPRPQPRARRPARPPTWARSPRSAQAWLGDPVAIKDPTAATFRRQGGAPPPDRRPEPRGRPGDPGLGPDRPGRAVPAPPRRHRPPRGPVRDPRRHARGRPARRDPGPGRRRTAPAGRAGHLARLGPGRRRPGRGGRPPPGARRRRRARDLPRRPRRRPVPRPPPPRERLRLRLDPRGGRPHRPPPRDPPRRVGRRRPPPALGRQPEQPQPILRQPGDPRVRGRVLFQMSSNDSAHLLDAPAASKLGPNRALFSGLEQDRLEKFRPYAIPAESWLIEAGRRLHDRTP